MSVLFGRDVKTIGKHINNALREELKSVPTVAFFATVQNEGGRNVTRQIEYYNLDMVISVGYRVKSDKGILFRQWANRVLKDHLLKGYSINSRISQLQGTLLEHERILDEHSKKIDFFVKTSMPPVEGIFFDGQIFDAYVFVSDLIKSAKKSIVLIDEAVYHIGASLKDLGRKWFAFSLMHDFSASDILEQKMRRTKH